MKKANKNIIGLFGLVLVFAMTVFAALLPGPETSALSSVTDTIVVIVQNPEDPPSAKIVSPDSGERFLTPDHNINVNHVNLKSYQLSLVYEDQDGNITTAAVANVANPVDVGTDTYDFRTIAKTYGYGIYTFRLDAVGKDNSAIEDTIEFTYAAIDAETITDEETDAIFVDMDFDQDQESLTDDLKIDNVVINVYDDKGNLVTEISPIVVRPPVGRVEIPFNERVPAGNYTVVAQPYNIDGEALYQAITMQVEYNGGIVVPSTADTGGLFKNLNISKADYLVTGLGVFFAVGIGGLIFMAKQNKTSGRRRK